LGNTQRPKRAVEIGRRMAAQPGAGVPAQRGSKALLKGADRLLKCPAVESEGLGHPPHAATRRAAGHGQTVLFSQDWPTLDSSPQPTKSGSGPVGARQPRGRLVPRGRASACAEPQSLGLADGQGSVREEAGSRTTKKPKGGRRSQGSEGRGGNRRPRPAAERPAPGAGSTSVTGRARSTSTWRSAKAGARTLGFGRFTPVGWTSARTRLRPRHRSGAT
jgi:hypothetical protein